MKKCPLAAGYKAYTCYTTALQAHYESEMRSLECIHDFCYNVLYIYIIYLYKLFIHVIVILIVKCYVFVEAEKVTVFFVLLQVNDMWYQLLESDCTQCGLDQLKN